jgi:hypothetical protein
LCQWIEHDDYTHAVTLNADREMSIARIESVFSTFCKRFDQAVLGLRNVLPVPASHRLRAVAFPEHLSTNAHLHCLMDLALATSRLSDAEVSKLVRSAWLKSNRGAGSVCIDQLTRPGFEVYASKGFLSTGGVYFFASDFHPR